MKNEKPTSSWKEIALGLLGLAAVVYILLQFASPTKLQPTTSKKPQRSVIKYTIQCDNCDVTYTTSSGTEMKSGVNNDWSYNFRASPGDTPYISAQNKNETGVVQVYLWLNGKMIKHAKSEGPYVIAQVDAYLQ